MKHSVSQEYQSEALNSLKIPGFGTRKNPGSQILLQNLAPRRDSCDSKSQAGSSWESSRKWELDKQILVLWLKLGCRWNLLEEQVLKKQEIGRGMELEWHPEGFCLSRISLGLGSDTSVRGRVWKHKNPISEGETAAPNTRNFLFQATFIFVARFSVSSFFLVPYLRIFFLFQQRGSQNAKNPPGWGLLGPVPTRPLSLRHFQAVISATKTLKTLRGYQNHLNIPHFSSGCGETWIWGEIGAGGTPGKAEGKMGMFMLRKWRSCPLAAVVWLLSYLGKGWILREKWGKKVRKSWKKGGWAEVGLWF